MSEKELQAMANMAAEAAVKRMNEEKKRTRDKRLANAKLLLSHYREFKEFSKSAIYTAKQAEIESASDILDLMWDPNNKSERVVESIKRSAITTTVIMAHIDGMLKVYENICNSSKRDYDRRRYNVMYDRYISDETYEIEEIAERYHIDPRTVYMDLDVATDKMAKLIFGIDSVFA